MKKAKRERGMAITICVLQYHILCGKMKKKELHVSLNYRKDIKWLTNG